MADIDKAIGSDDLIDLDVENKDKSINVEVPEEIEVDLSVFERQDDGTLTFGSVLTPDLSEQFNDNLAEYLEQDELDNIYSNLVDAVEADKSSRQGWEETYKEGLETLGIQTTVYHDGIKIIGCEIGSGTVNSNHDHRIAMAFSIAAIRSSGEVLIEDCKNVATSFPNFIDLAKELGMRIDSEVR